MSLRSNPATATDEQAQQERKEYTPPTDGIHKIVIVEAEEKTSQAGNPMRKTKMKLLEGPDAGKPFYGYWVLTEKALWKLNLLGKALGIEEEVDWMENRTWTKKIMDEPFYADLTSERSPTGKGWRTNTRPIPVDKVPPAVTAEVLEDETCADGEDE